ncbi:MAG: 4-hydroxy-tetrahydrodipicolinate synthase [Fimbriimonadales bacterium]
MGQRLFGVFPAVITPFDEEGRIDSAAFVRLLAWHESVGCDGVVVSGTNGEAASMTVRERMDLFTLAATHRGKLRIIAGTGSANLEDTNLLNKHAAAEGCDAALVMPPYYFKNPPQAGVREYYLRVLDAARLPVLLYNIPQITDTPIEIETLAELADHPNLLGMKDSSGSPDYLRAALQRLPGRCVMVGQENLLLECLRLGGAGTVSGASNAYPELAVAVVRAFQTGGDPESAQERLSAMNDVLRQYGLPAAGKAAVRARGLPGGKMRLPLLDLTEGQTSEMMARFESLGLPTTV